MLAGGRTTETLEGRSLKQQKGFAGGREVTVLRDNGCDLAAVQREFKEGNFLRKKITMITMDGYDFQQLKMKTHRGTKKQMKSLLKMY